MGMVSETSTVRTMRYILKNYKVGEHFYAYEISKAVGVDPQRILRIFKNWSDERKGYLKDLGLKRLPEGLALGPARRYYEITELGLDTFKSSLSVKAKK